MTIGFPKDQNHDYKKVDRRTAAAEYADGKEVQFLSNGEWVTIEPYIHSAFVFQHASYFRLKK
ncbi:hypothetical protein [Jeotgalibacillus terrae]|uniref:Uncharacterized protein n=1 Tax=Jeotgalibacillus terrae TaxID=587735 RepID=A0ABW5ZG66_9BACL|nr:hypothetical protein [Jeotgalibacillus terrae]MBM7577699.1 hypothetical protein [Jeotgalibacillus terrae]